MTPPLTLIVVVGVLATYAVWIWWTWPRSAGCVVSDTRGVTEPTSRWWKQPPPPAPPSPYAAYLDGASLPGPPPVPPTKPEFKHTNHVLHLLLAVLTCGVWAPIWLLIYLHNDKLTRGQKDWYERTTAEYTHARWLWDTRTERGDENR